MGFQLTSHWCLGDLRARWWARSFAIASLFHVALPDFDHSDWFIPRLLIGTTALILLWRPVPLMFLINAAAHVITLFFLRDVLTQSVLLLIFAVAGAQLSSVWRPARLHGLSLITAITYLCAAIHKINTGFVSLESSCSLHALAQVGQRWGVTFPPEIDVYIPWLTIAVEVFLAVSLGIRSRWYWLLAFGFHLPLVVTLAPAFGAVVLCGASAGLTSRDLVLMRVSVQKHVWLWILFAFTMMTIEGLVGTSALSVVQHVQVGWYALACALAFVCVRPAKALTVARPWRMPCVWFLFCMTPYLGIQVQHTGAMLSNLRVDSNCHNSLIFSPNLVFQDQYIRLKHVQFGTDQWSKRKDILERGLWNEAALFTMRKNWCVPWARPLAMSVIQKGETTSVPDLCNDGALDFLSVWQHRFSGYQRFQKNLTQACDQRCIH